MWSVSERHATEPKITFSMCTHGWNYKMCLQVKEQLTPSCTATKAQRTEGQVVMRMVTAAGCLGDAPHLDCYRHGPGLHVKQPLCVPQWLDAKANLTVTVATLALSGASRRCEAAAPSILCCSSPGSLLIHASWLLSLSSLFTWAEFLPVKQSQTTAVDICIEQSGI